MAACHDEINAWFVPSWNNYCGVVKDMTDILGAVLIYLLSLLKALHSSNSAGTLKSGRVARWLYPEVKPFFFLLQVKNWVKELKKMLGSEICLIIAGNKVDLEKQRTVSFEDAEE
jgi:hypothetical protein